jgi:hypothetical protein
VATREDGYESRAWNFPSLEARSGFETALQTLENRASVEVFSPEDVDEKDLRYGDGLSYTLENIDELLEGNYEFIRRYKVRSPARTPFSRNIDGFLASVVRPEVRGEVYIVDSVKGAAVLGDEPLVDYVSEKVDSGEKSVVDRIVGL